MKFKFGQWLASFGGSVLGLFSTGKKVSSVPLQHTARDTERDIIQ